jgi:hypothetical protein
MRDLLRSTVPLLALALGCATARPPETRERPAGYAKPVSDPALADNVQVPVAPLVGPMDQVSVRVRATDHPLSRMEVLAPELTAAQAEEMRRALVDCACRPAEGGVATYVVNFGR